jgi:hypothetical protein
MVIDAEVSVTFLSPKGGTCFRVHDQSGYDQICCSDSLLNLFTMLFRRVEFYERGGVEVKDQ